VSYAWQRQPCSAASQPQAVAQLQAGRASLDGAAASWQPHWQASPAQVVQVQRSFMAWFIALFIESSSRLVGSADIGCPMSALWSPARGAD
jgi:hypothetical protein